MKKLTQMICVAVLALGMSAAQAEKVTAGPKGGRILEKTEPKAEFLVEQDKTASITFYDAEMKPVPAAEQSVTVIADAKDGKQKIEFEKKGDVLVSKSKLPNVEDGNVVVQLKQKADARPQNFRFKVNTETCGECKRAEYACICGH
jgi:hypothetical protein